MSSTSGNSGISLFGHFPWIRWLAKRVYWIPNLSWPFYKAMQTNPPSMVGDVFVQLQQQIFVFPKEFSTCSKDVMSPGWHGRSWLFSLWLRPPSLPATSSLTGRASAPSQAWRNRELCITFARPPIRTRKVFQRKHANWQISLRTSHIVTPAKYTVDMFSAHSWRSLCKDWHLFPPQCKHQPYLESLKSEPVEVNLIKKLNGWDRRTAYFVDREVGVVFRRFQGDGFPNYKAVNIQVDSLASQGVDCTQRAFISKVPNKYNLTFMSIFNIHTKVRKSSYGNKRQFEAAP